MKKILITMLIAVGIFGMATSLYAIRFDWSLGQPVEVLDGDVTSTTSDSVWWVSGQPAPVSSTTEAGAPAPAAAVEEVFMPGTVIGPF